MNVYHQTEGSRASLEEPFADCVKSFSSLQKFNKVCCGQSRLCQWVIYKLRDGFDGDEGRHLDRHEEHVENHKSRQSSLLLKPNSEIIDTERMVDRCWAATWLQETKTVTNFRHSLLSSICIYLVYSPEFFKPWLFWLKALFFILLVSTELKMPHHGRHHF